MVKMLLVGPYCLKVMEMYQFLIVWSCWLLWCIATFFLSNNKIRLLYSTGLLLCLILLPYQVIIIDLPLNVCFIFLLLYTSCGVIYQKLPIKKYLFILFISYMYAIYFLWRLTSPVLNDFAFILIAVVSVFLLTQFTSKNKYNQIIILITGLTFGQLLFGLICLNYFLQYTINYFHYFLILFAVLLLVAIQHSWEFVIEKIESIVKVIEFKKRWNS
ncbi:YphA family membrane protein [Gracilibacillus kekensis]